MNRVGSFLFFLVNLVTIEATYGYRHPNPSDETRRALAIDGYRSSCMSCHRGGDWRNPVDRSEDDFLKGLSRKNSPEARAERLRTYILSIKRSDEQNRWWVSEVLKRQDKIDPDDFEKDFETAFSVAYDTDPRIQKMKKSRKYNRLSEEEKRKQIKGSWLLKYAERIFKDELGEDFEKIAKEIRYDKAPRSMVSKFRGAQADDDRQNLIDYLQHLLEEQESKGVVASGSVPVSAEPLGESSKNSASRGE